MLTPIEQACQVAGGSTKLAIAIGKRKAVISQWKTSRVPAEYCPEIERVTGVRCEALRPDVNWGVLRGTAA